MDAAVRVGDRAIGIVCLEHVGPMREWTVEEQAFAGSLTDFVAIAVEADERRQAVAARSDSEERLAQLVDSVQAIVWRGDPDTFAFTFVSEEAETLLGYSIERWIHEPGFWFNHMHPDDRRWVPQYCSEETRRLHNHEFEYRMISGDGSIVWLRDIVKVIVRNGKVVESVGVMIDVTERKQAEEALERQRSFLRQVIDTNPSFVFAKDRDGRFTLVNDAIAEAYGTTIDDLIGRTDADFNTNTDEVARFRRDDLEVMDRRCEKFIPEEVVTDSAGRTRWLQTIKRPIVEADGRANQVLGVATDITRRKLAEEGLRGSEERLRQIIDLVPHLIFAKDRDGCFLLANAATAEAYGTTVEQLVGHRPTGAGSKAGSKALADDRDVIERGRTKFIPEDQFFDASGATRILQTTKIPFRQLGTNEPAVLVVAIDVTERKVAEERQALMMRELDHRVKNNLAAVLSIAEQTAAGAPSLDDFVPTFTGRIRSLAIAHEILARTSWDGAELGEMAARLLEAYRRREEGRIELEGQPILLPATVAPPLCMIIHELASNAAKYGALSVPEGRVRLAWRVLDVDDNGRPGPHLELQWTERNGPPVEPPSRRGLGTELIEEMVVYQLHGRSDLRFDASGVQCALAVPVGVVGPPRG